MIDIIDEAKKEINICVYTFTNMNIAATVLKKGKEGVKIRIITDDV